MSNHLQRRRPNPAGQIGATSAALYDQQSAQQARGRGVSVTTRGTVIRRGSRLGMAATVPVGTILYVWREVLRVRGIDTTDAWAPYADTTHDGIVLRVNGAAGAWCMCNGATVDLSRFGLGASVTLPNLVDRYLRGATGALSFDFAAGEKSEDLEAPDNYNGNTSDSMVAHPLYNHAHEVATTTINSAASGTPVEVVIPSTPYGAVKSTSNAMHTTDASGTWCAMDGRGRLGAVYEVALVRVG